MNLEKRIDSFAELGAVMRDTASGKSNSLNQKLLELIEKQSIINPWFTPGNVRMAIGSTGEMLTAENLKKWTSAYPALNNNNKPLTAGIIMAGNIPIVGFHDFLCVLISGYKLVARTSSKDPDLMPEISKVLTAIEPAFSDRIIFTDGVLPGFDIVIATGSDNSSRYFEYYFGKYPHIIRKNRNSIAVISGNETDQELRLLGKDIFSYFGLGCRNISKLMVVDGYDVSKLPVHWEEYSPVANNQKYANNYDFNKAVYLVNRIKFLDTGFLLIREDKSLNSPVGVLHYENYASEELLNGYIKGNTDKIQCITGRNWLPFGTAQAPQLWDYADNADTLDFLLKKNMPRIL